MKFTTSIVAVVMAVAISASAIPDACNVDGQSCMKIKRTADAMAGPWCTHPGQICTKEKREAWCSHPGQICTREADAEAEAYAEAWCTHPGQICTKVKRAAEAFAEALAEPDFVLDARCESGECFDARLKTRQLANVVAMTRDAPEEFIRSLNLRDESILRRNAEAHEEKRWCTHPGQICTKEKREAWCTHPGQICTRDAEASCGDAGGPCQKLKRAAEALAEAVALPEAQPWCTHPGQICTKEKRDALAIAEAWCSHPGQICTKAKRDAYALAAAANEVLASL